MPIEEMRLWLYYLGGSRSKDPAKKWESLCPADDSSIDDFKLLLQQANQLTSDDEDQISCAKVLERMHPGLPHEIYLFACHVVTGEFTRF